jgi:hypothetical protein
MPSVVMRHFFYTHFSSITTSNCQINYMTMNWTGGRLQRGQKNSGNTAANRQTQHFAKVRLQVQNNNPSTHRTVPFRSSFLIHDGSSLAGHTAPIGPDVQRHVGHVPRIQKTLEEYRSTAPLARRLASMKKRAPTRAHSRRRADASSRNIPRQAARVMQRQPEPTRLEAHNQNSHPRIQRVKSNASSPASSRKKEHVQQSVEVETVEANRKRLLQQSDWVGLAPSRPIQMQFWSCQDKERIGKRRRIDREIDARRAVIRGVKSQGGYNGETILTHRPFRSGMLPNIPKRVSVRIGDDLLMSDIVDSSSEIEEAIQPQAVPVIHRQSSDTMLFDAEEEIGAQYVDELAQSLPCQSQHNEDDVHLDEDMSRTPNADDHFDQGIEQQLYPIHAADPADEEYDCIPEVAKGFASPRCRTSALPYHLVFESSSVEISQRQSASYVPQSNDMLRSTLLADKLDRTPPRNRGIPSLDYGKITSRTNRIDEFQRRSAKESVWENIWSVPSSVSGRSDADSSWRRAEEQATTPSKHSSLLTHQATVVNQSRYDVDSSVRVTQSPSASLRNIMTLAELPPVRRVTSTGTSNANEEELWKRLVFGDEEESTPSVESQDKEITQPPRLISRPPASSLFVGVSTTSSSGTGDALVELSLEDDQRGPLGCVSGSAESADRSDHDLKEASVRATHASSDTHQIARPGASDRKDRIRTTLLARCSMYNNTSGSNQTSGDDRRPTANDTRGNAHPNSKRGNISIKAVGSRWRD